MYRGKWPRLVAVTLLWLAFMPLDRTRAQPNILLIVSDDQGYRDLGCYGGPEIRTPHLDRLASAGVRLTSFYVTWPACTPSRGSLLTGRYPQRNGLYDMIRNDRVDDGHRYAPAEYDVSPERILGMDVREVMISDVLKGAGYRSGCFGKWDGGQLRRFLPLQRGFHEYYGFTNTGIDYFTHERYGVPSMRRGNEITTEDKGTYATTLFLREALQFLKTTPRDRPFFLYVPFNAPHGASNLDREIRGLVQAPKTAVEKYPKGTNRREERRRHFMAAVTVMDAAIGELIHELERSGRDENTLVIFLSDNGGGGAADNTPLRGGKSRMFEGGLRVPCIVWWPAMISGGTVSDEFLTSLEVLPTVLAAAGAEPPPGVVLDGFDMLPVLQGEIKSPRREMFWQRQNDRAARVARWKWVESSRGGGLFDLYRDKSETHDLSQERPDKLRMVKERFSAWQRKMQEAEPRGPFRDY